MARTSLTRRLLFSAGHRYRRPAWSDAENAGVFGACTHTNFHRQSYTCDLTVAGVVRVHLAADATLRSGDEVNA